MKKALAATLLVAAVLVTTACSTQPNTTTTTPEVTSNSSGTVTTEVKTTPNAKPGTVQYKVTTEGADIFYSTEPSEGPAMSVTGDWEKSTPQGAMIGFVLNVQGKTPTTNSSCEILLDGKSLSKKNGTGKVMCDAPRP